MKKAAIVSLIVAIVLIFSGGVMLMLGLSFAADGSDFNQKVAEKSYVVDEPFHSITIDTDTCDVIFVNTGSQFRMGCTETDKVSYAVVVEDGVLRISAVDLRQWYDFIGIFQKELEITLYLPENQYNALQIETDTGDITIPQGFFFDSAMLLSDTGDVDFSANVAGQLAIGVSTGDVDIMHTSIDQLEVLSSTGDIELENLLVSGDISLSSSTGEISADNVTCVNLYSQSSTGDTELENVLINGNLEIKTGTGDVNIENSDAGFVSIATTTGDVTGNFLSPKWFITETSTGDIRVPLSREGGECHITTDTGDIEFF